MDIDKLDKLLREHLIWADYNLETANKLLKTDPFTNIGVLGNNITGIISSIAVSLTILFFMIDFCNKAMLIKVNTPEEIFKLIFRIFVAKSFVTQASSIMAMLYNGFNSLATSIITTEISIIPNDGTIMNGDAIKMFLSADEIKSLTNDPGFLGLNVLVKYISLSPSMLVIWIASLVVSVILLGRLFEVIIYTAVAPIPLSTLASEGTHDIAKNFVKNYCAVCLQAFVVIAIFSAYGTMTTVLQSTGCNTGVLIFLSTVTLAGASAKSGSIAKTICGC